MDDFYRRVMSGQQRGLAAMSLRALTSLIEPVYREVVNACNAKFDRALANRADRPVISVGNITTGGTGKTPVVRWLAESLKSRGIQPAILMRGYKSKPGESSDEQELLRSQLGTDLVVHANPDRVAGAAQVLRDHPEVRAFILDDGFQHRRLHRDFDLVLVDATNPFGFGRILPRGLLREPLRGLARADAILITRADQAQSSIAHLEDELRKLAPGKPIFRCVHQQTGLEHLRGKRVVALSGIGNPDAFEQQLQAAGVTIVASKRFSDHHHYSPADIPPLNDEVDAIVTTEKDWMKIRKLNRSSVIWPVGVRIRFDEPAHESQLLAQIMTFV